VTAHQARYSPGDESAALKLVERGPKVNPSPGAISGRRKAAARRPAGRYRFSALPAPVRGLPAPARGLPAPASGSPPAAAAPTGWAPASTSS